MKSCDFCCLFCAFECLLWLQQKIKVRKVVLFLRHHLKIHSQGMIQKNLMSADNVKKYLKENYGRTVVTCLVRRRESRVMLIHLWLSVCMYVHVLSSGAAGQK